MPPAYRFELATEKDDSALRSVLARTSMPGEISLSFRREPSFYAAERAGNLDSQVIAVRNSATNEVVGLGCRSFRMMFVDGRVSLGGYLSNLRGLYQVRAGTLLARGYRFLKDLHADGRVPYYVTTILDDNHNAREILTSRRAGLPIYHPLGQLQTCLIPLYRRRRCSPPPDNVVRGLSGDLLELAVESLNCFNGRHQFAPWHTPADFRGLSPLLPGFSPENLYAYLEGSRIKATLGVWDQTSFKQSVVAGYSWRYQVVRPFCAAGAALGLGLRLPPVGRPFPYLYGSFLSHAPRCESHVAALLDAVLRDWSGRGYAYLVVGVHQRSLMGQLLESYAVSRKSSTVYMVYWEDLLDSPLPSHDLIPHLEVATL